MALRKYVVPIITANMCYLASFKQFCELKSDLMESIMPV